MSIETLGNNYEEEKRVHEHKDQHSLWDGREARTSNGSGLEKMQTILNTIKAYGNYAIDQYNYPIGRCARGHRAYYIYHQKNENPPIYLCKETRDRCPFEYYNFLALLKGEISYAWSGIRGQK